MRLSFWTMAAAFIVCAALPARATVIDNGIETGNNSVSITGGGQVFESFETPHSFSPAQLGDVELELEGYTGTSGSVVITLWSGTSDTTPTTKLATLATVSTQSLANAFGSATMGILALNNTAPIPGTGSLSTSTYYWIGIQLVGGPSHGSTVSLELAGSTGSGVYYNGAPGSGTIESNEFIESCEDNGVSPTCASTISSSLTVDNVNAPEPASLALLGTAMAGLGLIRRRRARRSATKV